MTALAPDALPQVPIRVLYQTWNTGDLTWSAWQALPMAQTPGVRDFRRNPGLTVERFSRKALPGIGEATLTWRSAFVNGQVWNDPPALSGARVRIQTATPVAVGAEDTTTPTGWVTRWIGVVQAVERDRAGNLATYHCIDILADYAQRAQLVRHHFGSTTAGINLDGHPGYNTAVEGIYARKIGNRDPSTTPVDPWSESLDPAINGNLRHTYPGAPGAALWTDFQALNHALWSARGKGDPQLTLLDPQQLLSQTNLSGAWPVAPGTTVWSLLNAICDRRRGRGLAFFDWADDSVSPFAEPTYRLRVRAQVIDDISVDIPNDYAITLFGQGTSSAKALDYTDDPRLQAGPVLLDRAAFRYDQVISKGERIQVLVTLAYRESTLEKRWTTADQTAFNAITNPYWRSMPRWDPVYQRHGLPLAFDWKVGDGTNTVTKQSINLVCQDSGRLVQADVDGGVWNSLLTTRVLSDLCLYEGYDYPNNVLGGSRYDGATDTFSPPRLPPLALQKDPSTAIWQDLFRLGFGLQTDEQWGVYLRYGPDGSDLSATRYFGTPGSTPGIQADLQNLALTCTLELSNRVSMSTGYGRRVLRLNYPGIHLWAASPNAIWKLDRTATTVAAAPAVKGPGALPSTLAGSNPLKDTDNIRLIRDDRPWLAVAHQLACQWYLTDHKPISLTLQGTPWLYVNTAGTDQSVGLGDIISTITTNNFTPSTFNNLTPQVDTVNCPVTSLTYDVQNNQTQLDADWADLDFAV